MSKIVKQPRIDQYIDGPTGRERIEVVKDHGRRLMVQDAIGRIHTRDRADTGHWVVID